MSNIHAIKVVDEDEEFLRRSGDPDGGFLLTRCTVIETRAIRSGDHVLLVGFTAGFDEYKVDGDSWFESWSYEEDDYKGENGTGMPVMVAVPSLAFERLSSDLDMNSLQAEEARSAYIKHVQVMQKVPFLAVKIDGIWKSLTIVNSAASRRLV